MASQAAFTVVVSDCSKQPARCNPDEVIMELLRVDLTFEWALGKYFDNVTREVETSSHCYVCHVHLQTEKKYLNIFLFL